MNGPVPTTLRQSFMSPWVSITSRATITATPWVEAGPPRISRVVYGLWALVLNSTV